MSRSYKLSAAAAQTLIDGLSAGLKTAIDEAFDADWPRSMILRKIRSSILGKKGGLDAQGELTYLACRAYIDRRRQEVPA